MFVLLHFLTSSPFDFSILCYDGCSVSFFCLNKAGSIFSVSLTETVLGKLHAALTQTVTTAHICSRLDLFLLTITNHVYTAYGVAVSHGLFSVVGSLVKKSLTLTLLVFVCATKMYSLFNSRILTLTLSWLPQGRKRCFSQLCWLIVVGGWLVGWSKLNPIPNGLCNLCNQSTLYFTVIV